MGVGQSFLADLAEIKVFANSTLESDADNSFDTATVTVHVLVSCNSSLSEVFSNGSHLGVARLLDDLLNDSWTLSVKFTHDELLDNLVLRQRLLFFLLLLVAVMAVMTVVAVVAVVIMVTVVIMVIVVAVLFFSCTSSWFLLLRQNRS